MHSAQGELCQHVTAGNDYSVHGAEVQDQPVHESSRPGHRDGHEMKESVGTSCYDEGVQMRAS